MSITSVVNDLVTSVSVINALKPLPPTISGYSVAGKDDIALDPAGGQTVQINGTGFLPGATITFDGSAVAVVTYVNPNQLTFTSPAKTAGTYTIYAVNPDGGTAIYVPGIIYSTLPTWTTAAGSLGSYYETTSISNTVVAAGDAPVTYSLYSGSLPTGSTLYANGVITGTAPVDSSSTTYSFTIQASDAQLQDSTRSFSLTINVDAVTWVSPANATTYTSAVDSAISNVALSATDAAGYAVSYSANALPTGLSLSGANISGTPTVIADSSTLLTATAATTNRTAVRTINWSITVANDPYFEYNTLLIPGASTTFVDDASTNNFAVSIFGDTKPNNFNPYTPGYYSNYFDGNGDYFSVSNNVALQFGSESFTLECWIYITGGAGTRRQILGKTFAGATAVDYSYSMEVDASNKLTFYVCNGSAFTSVSSTNTIGLNAWYHVASVRDGNTLRIFINGVAEGTTAFASSINDNASALSIGITGSYLGLYFLGNISNARIVKGTAVYTTTFTPSTTPLTAISGTSLLTCQSNRFIDNSTNNFTITVAGNTTINSFDPFVPNTSYSTYGSGYFDGTGDYLTLPVNSNLAMGTGNFTIEFWLFTTNISQTGYILQTDILSTSLYVSLSGSTVRLTDQNTVFATTSTLLNNTWYHIAVVRSGTSSVIYTNGVAGTAVTCNINFSQNGPTIGANSFIGYLSDYRIVKGTAVYTTAFTPPSAPLTAIANTSLLVLQNNQSVNNSVFLDNSTNNLPVTYVGKATQGTFSPYGGNWSNYFDGTGDYLTLNGTPGTTLTGNFTLEAWVYVINFAASRAIICIGDVFGNPGVMFFIDTAGKLGISYANSRPYTGSGSLTANTWNHVAFVRNSGVITGYINGVSQGTLSTANTFSGTTSYIGLERYNGGAGGVIMFGYISNLRIVNSTAVYTGTFTPPTTPLTPITNTGLLTCADNRLIDDSINNFTITKNGDVSVQRFSPFNPSSLTATSYSGYFDGTGDYLTVPFNSAFNLGSGNFTIEFWVRTTSTAAYATALRLGDTWTTGSWALYLNDAGGSGVPSWWSQTLSNTLTSSGATINDGAWHHIALVRNSATMTMYIDGTSRGTLSVSTSSVGDTSTSLWIARDSSNVRELAGYLSNIRIVKGTALYTSNFTPSTTPLTTTSQGATASQVSLLTLQSPTIVDNSTNNFTLTAFGNSQPLTQNPFGYTSATTQGYSVSTIGGSGYSNATGTIYSNIASPIAGNANAWTMECWVYFNTISGNVFIMGIGNNTGGNTPYLDLRISSTTVTLEESSTVSGIWAAAATFACTVGQWYHFAATRSGSTIRLFINGVQLASTTYASAIQSGLKPFTNGLLFSDGSARSDGVNGYVSDTRMIAGTALYTSNFVPPSQPLTAVQNTSWLINATSAGIYDAAMMTTMETIDGAKLSTAISKFGGSSMSFDGTNDQIQTPIIQPLRTGNFTIEFWIYPLDTASRYIFSFGEGWSPADGVSMIQYNGNYAITCGSYSTANAGQAVQINGWHHIAIVRNGTAVNFYYDGVSKASGTDSTNLTASKLDIGYAFTGGSWGTFYGYMDDFRITNGYARYTSNFTPPTSAFQLY